MDKTQSYPVPGPPPPYHGEFTSAQQQQYGYGEPVLQQPAGLGYQQPYGYGEPAPVLQQPTGLGYQQQPHAFGSFVPVYPPGFELLMMHSIFRIKYNQQWTTHCIDVQTPEKLKLYSAHDDDKDCCSCDTSMRMRVLDGSGNTILLLYNASDDCCTCEPNEITVSTAGREVCGSVLAGGGGFFSSREYTLRNSAGEPELTINRETGFLTRTKHHVVTINSQQEVAGFQLPLYNKAMLTFLQSMDPKTKALILAAVIIKVKASVTQQRSSNATTTS